MITGRSNQFVLERDLPPNDVLTTKLGMTLRSHNQWSGVLIHLDKDGYNLWRKAMFAKELDGQTNILEFEPRNVGGEGGSPKVDFIGVTKTPEDVWLRVEKKGNTFSASFSMDGRQWHKIGDHTMLRTSAARISLMASNELAGDSAEVAAEPQP